MTACIYYLSCRHTLSVHSIQNHMHHTHNHRVC